MTSPEEAQVNTLPVIFKNLDSSEYMYLPAKKVVASAKPQERKWSSKH